LCTAFHQEKRVCALASTSNPSRLQTIRLIVDDYIQTEFQTVSYLSKTEAVSKQKNG
jgi:hypothetical protein